MTKAPERIWAYDSTGHGEMGGWSSENVQDHSDMTLYLRADLAKAAEAAAYERAVNACEAERKALLNFGLSQAAIGASFCKRNLRALIDPEAASALDAVRAEVRRECVASVRAIQAPEIAEIIWGAFGGNDVARSSQAAKRVVEAIAAAIMEGKGDE